MEQPLRCLFIASNPTFSREMMRLATVLGENFSCRVIEDYKPGRRGALSSRARLARFKATLKKSRLGLFFFSKKNKSEVEKIIILGISQAKALADEFKPDIVFLSGDRGGGSLEMGFLYLAKNRHFVTAIPPVVVPADEKALFEFRRNKNDYRASKELMRKYPTVVRTDPFDGRLVSIYPVHHIEALKKYGLISQQPWVLGGGSVDWVMLSSERLARRMVEHGCNSDKIIVTGHVSHDGIHRTLAEREQRREQMCSVYHLSNSKKWIGVALPQFAEDNFMSWPEHWAEIDKIFYGLKTFFDTTNILVSLHPKMDAEKYEEYCKKWPVTIVSESLSEWIGVLDAFMAHYSSTVEWSVALGIRSFILDYQRHNLDIYGTNEILSVVHTQDELIPLLRGCLENPQLNPEHSFGKLDGKALERIRTAIYEITKLSRR
jgi:hypothetical protein